MWASRDRQGGAVLPALRAQSATPPSPPPGPSGGYPTDLFTSRQVRWHFPQAGQPQPPPLNNRTSFITYPTGRACPLYPRAPSTRSSFTVPPALPVSNPVKGKPPIFCYCLPTQPPPHPRAGATPSGKGQEQGLSLLTLLQTWGSPPEGGTLRVIRPPVKTPKSIISLQSSSNSLGT